MAGNKRKLYRKSSPWKILLGIFVAVLIILAVLAVVIFFSFQKYIVYTPDGLHLEVPWLEEEEPSDITQSAYIAEYIEPDIALL